MSSDRDTITVLAGGVGAARFLNGLSAVTDPALITAVVNTGDDTTLHGLRICPDLDTVTYTLAGAIDPDRGWGLTGETWEAMAALERYRPQAPSTSDAGVTWFGLGDRDLATHLYRTARLAEGATLTAVTAEIATAWGLELTVVPMSDEAVATRLVTTDGTDLAFQEYFVEHRHDVPVAQIRIETGSARLTEHAHRALNDASAVVIAPSNPLVSIGPIRALQGVDDLLTHRRERVIAISPIVGGRALKGPAARMLSELGHEASVVGVARMYRQIAATIVIDRHDAERAEEIRELGMNCVVTDTIMSDRARAAALGRITLDSLGWPP
jgi:LPPG:FO 2-phospho-L-lactate transferase